MQRRFLFGAAVLAGVLFASALAPPLAEAQGPRPARLTPYQRPSTSPYLNLLDFGGPAFNYHRRVRPELEFRRANAGQFRELRSLQQQIRAQELRMQRGAAIGPTGHGTAFFNYGTYYNFGR